MKAGTLNPIIKVSISFFVRLNLQFQPDEIYSSHISILNVCITLSLRWLAHIIVNCTRSAAEPWETDFSDFLPVFLPWGKRSDHRGYVRAFPHAISGVFEIFGANEHRRNLLTLCISLGRSWGLASFDNSHTKRSSMEKDQMFPVPSSLKASEWRMKW